MDRRAFVGVCVGLAVAPKVVTALPKAVEDDVADLLRRQHDPMWFGVDRQVLDRLRQSAIPVWEDTGSIWTPPRA